MADHQPQSTDPFDMDSLLTLEDTLYTTAYALGVQDGARAGRIEGRVFGLEKGFEKFAAMGVLNGRASVWGSRLPAPSPSTPVPKTSETELSFEKKDEGDSKEGNQDGEMEVNVVGLPQLPHNPRLQKHIQILYHLTDPLTFSTENTEDAVADFDDRFKRAGAKAKIIERIVGETNALSSVDGDDDKAKSPKSPKRVGKRLGGGVKFSGSGEGKKEDSMEDFAGSSLVR